VDCISTRIRMYCTKPAAMVDVEENTSWSWALYLFRHANSFNQTCILLRKLSVGWLPNASMWTWGWSKNRSFQLLSFAPWSQFLIWTLCHSIHVCNSCKKDDQIFTHPEKFPYLPFLIMYLFGHWAIQHHQCL
jgi:hypothetical protein